MNLLLDTVQLCKKVFRTTLLGGVCTQSLQSVRLFCFSQLKYLHDAPTDRYSEAGFVRDTYEKAKTIFVERKKLFVHQ